MSAKTHEGAIIEVVQRPTEDDETSVVDRQVGRFRRVRRHADDHADAGDRPDADPDEAHHDTDVELDAPPTHLLAPGDLLESALDGHPTRPKRPRRARDPFRLDDAVGQHVVMRLVDDRVLAREAADFRTIARVLLARGARRELVAFGCADNHIHAILTCSRVVAGLFAQAVEAALRVVLGLPVPFAPARFRPVMDQHHLGNSTAYSVRQMQRHGLRIDPLREARPCPISSDSGCSIPPSPPASPPVYLAWRTTT